MINMRYVEGEVVENHHWTPILHSLSVAAPIAEFIAGQFVKLALTVDGKRVSRPYSCVNAPEEELLEFYSVMIPGGVFSPRAQQLKKGDAIQITSKANGFLTLNEVPEGRFLWLLATGTGLGPFLSILKTSKPWERFERVCLVHGARSNDELTYGDTMRGFYAKHPEQFVKLSCVTREQNKSAISGRIPAAIRDGLLAREADMPFSKESQVMLCGNPGMVKDASSELLKLGLKKNRRREPGQITVESYW